VDYTDKTSDHLSYHDIDGVEEIWNQTTGKKPNMTDSFLYHTQPLLRYH